MKRSDNCRIICRKTKMCPLNILILHKVFIGIKPKEYEKLVLTEKVTNSLYIEKNIFEKVEKCPLKIACMLIFY